MGRVPKQQVRRTVRGRIFWWMCLEAKHALGDYSLGMASP